MPTMTRQRGQLLDAMIDVQQRFASAANAEEVLALLLNRLVKLTASRHGFAGTVERKPEGRYRVGICARSPERSHDEKPTETAPPYENPALEFEASDAAIGNSLGSGRPYFLDLSGAKPRQRHVPGIGQVCRSCMALPIAHEGNAIGLVVLADRRAGYDETLAEFVAPLLRCYAHEITARAAPGNPGSASYGTDDPAEAASRDQFYRLLERIPTAIMVTGIATGSVRFANRAARELLGIAAGQETRPDDLWNDPSARRSFLREFVRCGSASGEAQLRKPDGTTFVAYLHWQESPLDPNDVLCWSMDISETKDVLRRLQSHERMLQEIVEAFPIALFCKDINDDFRYTLANPMAGVFSGVPSEEMIGRTDFELYPPDLAAKLREQDIQLARTGVPVEVLEEMLEPNPGEIVYGHYKKIAVADSQGRPAFIVGFCADITERRASEHAHIASERRFRELAEHAPAGIFMTDPRGGYIFANRHWQQSSGMTLDDCAGTGWTAAVHPEDRAEVVERWSEFVYGQGSFALEYRFLRNGGEVVWISSKAIPFRNEAGEIVGFLGTTIDFSERKRFEEQLRHSRDEAQRANQAKSEFLSRMSHELRTPLNAILGFGQLLQLDSGGFSETQKEGVDQLLAGAENLLALIDDVLDYSRIETGRVWLSVQSVDVAEPLERALSLVSVLAEKHGVSLAVPPAPACRVMADPRSLQQILVNLLTNAVKYNRRGGMVRITHSQNDLATVRISVQDTGRGIRREDHSRIFEPFERIVDVARVVDGTGIGLSICRRLVEMMGGCMGFESEFGKGSTFWLDLKAADAAEERHIVPA